MIKHIYELPTKYRPGDNVNWVNGFFINDGYLFRKTEEKYQPNIVFYKILIEEMGLLRELIVGVKKGTTNYIPILQKIFGVDTYIYIAGINKLREFDGCYPIISNRQRFINECKYALDRYTEPQLMYSLEKVFSENWAEIAGMLPYDNISSWSDGYIYICERVDIIDNDEFTPCEFSLLGSSLDHISKHILKYGKYPIYKPTHKDIMCVDLINQTHNIPKNINPNLSDSVGAISEIIDFIITSPYTDIMLYNSDKENITIKSNRYTADVDDTPDYILTNATQQLFYTNKEVVAIEVYKSWEEEGYIKMINKYGKTYTKYFSIPYLIVHHPNYESAINYYN